MIYSAFMALASEGYMGRSCHRNPWHCHGIKTVDCENKGRLSEGADLIYFLSLKADKHELADYSVLKAEKQIMQNSFNAF